MRNIVLKQLIYIQGSKNIAADILRRLDVVNTPNPVQNDIESVNIYYGLEDDNKKDKELIKIARTKKDYSIRNFHGADKEYCLICKNR